MTPVTAPGHAPWDPRAQRYPGHEPRDGALRAAGAQGRENAPVTMLGGAGAARCHSVPPGATRGPPPALLPWQRLRAQAPPSAPSGRGQVWNCPAASLIGCHAVGTAHSLIF